MSKKIKKILLFFFIVVIISEFICIHYWEKDIDKKIRREENNKKSKVIVDSQIEEGIQLLNETVLGPIDIFKKVFFYKIFNFLPFYYTILILVVCFILKKFFSFIKKMHRSQEVLNI